MVPVGLTKYNNMIKTGDLPPLRHYTRQEAEVIMNQVEVYQRRFEAENAKLSQANVATNHTGFTGTGFVDYVNTTGGYVEWTVTRTAAGTVRLTFRYANGLAPNRPLNVSVNGGTATAVNFPGTGSWNTWATTSVTVTLKAGTNTIRATATTANGGPNMDSLSVA